MLWTSQVTPKDVYVVGCSASRDNCPDDEGPDFDFGNSAILRELPNGKSVIVIGQKSGVVWALDPDNNGTIVWQRRVGKGSALGGLEWGSAADQTIGFTAHALTPSRPRALEPSSLALPLLTAEKGGIQPRQISLLRKKIPYASNSRPWKPPSDPQAVAG